MLFNINQLKNEKMKFPVITGKTRVPPVPTPSGTYSGGQFDGIAVFDPAQIPLPSRRSRDRLFGRGIPFYQHWFCNKEIALFIYSGLIFY